MANFVRFKQKTATDFAIIEKDSNTIYFVSDSDANVHQIYLGNLLFGVDLINNIDAPVNNFTAFSSTATKQLISNKIDKCAVHTYTDTTSLPAVVELHNNEEYRYLELTGATGLNIKISNASVVEGTFYSSIVLHNLNTTNAIADFITVDNSSQIQNIVFLNGDFDLSDSETAEFLFFANGMSGEICCIGYGYTVEPPL